MSESEAPRGELLLYQTEDGRTRIECRFEGETIWLTQVQLAELFETSVPNVNIHLKAVFEEGELDEQATIKSYLMVRAEGTRRVQRAVLHYSLPVVIAVGFRVRSHRGTQFRKWATRLLDEYVVKGFALDDERHKNPPGPGQTNYFEQLLARIRDIRSSERVFWMKVLDIYATSADYDARIESSRAFFKSVQNKMHWAAHGQTAAEVIVARADASKPNMGLTSWSTGVPRKADVAVAKNYLSSEELEALNRIVNAYLRALPGTARSPALACLARPRSRRCRDQATRSRDEHPAARSCDAQGAQRTMSECRGGNERWGAEPFRAIESNPLIVTPHQTSSDDRQIAPYLPPG